MCLLALAFIHTLRTRARFVPPPSEAGPSLRAHWWQRQWIRVVVRRCALVVAPVLVNGLYASFANAQSTLQHVDPLVFVAVQLALLLPVALVLLCCTLRSATREYVRVGLLGGLPLGIGFVCVALSLRALGIIPTAMLTALDGIVASLTAWLAFRQRLSVYTCLAAVCAGGGACLLWWIEPSRWQADVVALACGVMFTVYAFHVEHHAVVRQKILPFLGGLFASMAAIALVLALCFGHWETLQTMTDADRGILLYSSLVTVLIPLVISTVLLRYVSAITLAFLAVLEPLISVGFAYTLGSISLGIVGWCGVGLILLSMLLQANASRPQSTKKQEELGTLEPDPEISGTRSATR
jgi:drug/metabolite transporter, DME family